MSRSAVADNGTISVNDIVRVVRDGEVQYGKLLLTFAHANGEPSCILSLFPAHATEDESIVRLRVADAVVVLPLSAAKCALPYILSGDGCSCQVLIPLEYRP